MNLRTACLAIALLTPVPALGQDFQERWRARVAAFRSENARLDPDQRTVVLLGSSSMEGWKNRRRIERYLPASGHRALNRGISGDGIGISSQTGVLNRLGPSALDCQPSHIVLLNGRNSVGSGVARTAAVYRQVVERLRAGAPRAVVILVTCAPVRGGYAHLKEPTARLNDAIRAIAREQGCRLIDLHPLLTDGDGLLKRSLTRDGLHFGDEGYRLLGAAIERIVAESPTGTAAPAEDAGPTHEQPAETPEAKPAPRCATVRVRTRLNLRAGPGLDQRRVGSACDGDRFEVLEVRGAWVRLRTASGDAVWAHGDFLVLDPLPNRAGIAGRLGG